VSTTSIWSARFRLTATTYQCLLACRSPPLWSLLRRPSQRRRCHSVEPLDWPATVCHDRCRRLEHTPTHVDRLTMSFSSSSDFISFFSPLIFRLITRGELSREAIHQFRRIYCALCTGLYAVPTFIQRVFFQIPHLFLH